VDEALGCESETLEQDVPAELCPLRLLQQRTAVYIGNAERIWKGGSVPITPALIPLAQADQAES